VEQTLLGVLPDAFLSRLFRFLSFHLKVLTLPSAFLGTPTLWTPPPFMDSPKNLSQSQIILPVIHFPNSRLVMHKHISVPAKTPKRLSHAIPRHCDLRDSRSRLFFISPSPPVLSPYIPVYPFRLSPPLFPPFSFFSDRALPAERIAVPESCVTVDSLALFSLVFYIFSKTVSFWHFFSQTSWWV